MIDIIYVAVDDQLVDRLKCYSYVNREGFESSRNHVQIGSYKASAISENDNRRYRQYSTAASRSSLIVYCTELYVFNKFDPRLIHLRMINSKYHLTIS